MNIFLFIVWLIGAILSAYFEYKYAEAHKMVKHIWNVFNKQTKISDKIFTLCCFVFVISVVIPGYIVLSWFGALITYIIFNSRDE